MIGGIIVKIVDEHTVVIDRGHEHGVEEDMRFVIFELGDEIMDPDTRTSLGKLEHVKAKIKVTNVQEKFSTAETYKTYTMPILPPFLNTTVREELPLDKETIASLQKLPRTSVKIGDLVRQILD